MRTVVCNSSRKETCCIARFFPLVAAWATTVHKFQGSEAGHGEFDRFKYLIINPPDKRWEQQQLGT